MHLDERIGSNFTKMRAAPSGLLARRQQFHAAHSTAIQLPLAAVGLLALAISVSTLLVKQHLLIDVVVGMAWAFGWFAVAERVYRAWRARSDAADEVR